MRLTVVWGTRLSRLVSLQLDKMRIHKCIVWLILCLFLLLVVPAVSWFMWQYRSWNWRSPVPVTDDRILEMLQSRPSPVPASSSASVENGREDITATQQAFKSWNRSVITLIEPKIPRNCSALMSGDAAEINRVEQSQQNWKSSSYNKKFNKLYIDSGDCQEIRTEFENNLYVSEEERSFPLAFSMTVHNDAQQIVRFLKAIYRPQNIYCIHYDKKSSSTFKKIFDNIAKCLNNVIIPKKIVNIVYECYPILEAQLSCMADLLKERKAFPWKYTTTLCGKEIPLRTNREMVHLLKQMKGLPVVYAHDFLSGEYSIKMHRMKIKKNICTRTWTAQKQPVPYGLKLLKSMAYFSLTPEFTNFILNSAEGKALYQFLKPTKGPEEAFYGTLLQYWLNGEYMHVQNHTNI